MMAIQGGWRRTVRALWSDRSGAFTLEASMVLPWIMILTFVVMLFALFVSQTSVLYYSAAITAERAAFNWPNSYKELQTGAYPHGRYDGLYWRLMDDALLQGVLGLAAGGGTVEVPIAPVMPDASVAGAVGKLARAGATMPSSLSGEVSFRNVGIKRTVSIHSSTSWLPGALFDFGVTEPATANVSALIVEPTELIRSFDLVRYYAVKMRQAPEGEAAYRDQAATAIRSRRAAAR